MRPGKRWIAATILIAAADAGAQSPGAEQLFRDGRALIKNGEVADGCDKLAASDRLEPSIGTLLNLGDCREKLGQIATAWAAFRQAEAMAHRAGNDHKREAEARRRAERLETKLTRLEIDVPHPTDGLVVRRDDETVDAAMYGTLLPVDPGTHTIVATAPDHTPWKRTLLIDGRRAQITVPALDRATIVRPALADEPAAPPIDPVVPRIAMTAKPRSRWTVTRELSLGLGVASLGALATGVYFGLRSSDLRDQADQRCPDASCSDPEGLRLNAGARSDATRANILYAAGGVAAIASLVLWFAGSPGDTAIVTPSVGDRRAGMSYTRSF